MKKSKRIAWLLVLACFLCVNLVPALPVHAVTVDEQAEENSRLQLVAQSDQASLYLDERDALLRLVDRNGVAYETKIMNGDSGNANIQANQKSDFMISYWDTSRSASGQNTTTQENYTMAVEREQVAYEEIDGGVRVTYTLKEDKLSLDVVPKYISEERMEELLFPYITSEQREWLRDYYRLYEGVYTRTKDGGVTQSVIRTLYEMFFETGAYTEEDLLADNQEHGYESTWSNLEIQASVEYTLEGSDLVVRVPMEDIQTNNENIVVNTITLLPYMLSASSQEEGYYVVPDGSGAVIHFNNGLTSATDYSSRVYGTDALIDVESVANAEYYANMPVIGAVYEDYALLAIVEEGESLAEVNVRISGKVDNYNTSYFRFYITEMENVATTSSSSVQVKKFTGDTYNKDIVVRFRLLTDETECNYVGLARAYQDYLVNQGVLSRQENEKASLVLELFGAAYESKTLLGVPYIGTSALTTYAEAEEILTELNQLGVGDAYVQLDGWLDGGQYHELLNQAKLEGTQGSKRDFTSLVETASSLGYGLYPDIALQTLNYSTDFLQGGRNKSYAKKYGSRQLDNTYARVLETFLGRSMKGERVWTPYLLSPANLTSYTETAMKKLDGYNLSGYTITDVGTALIADYNEKSPVSRENAMSAVQEAISVVTADHQAVLKNPYQYAWNGASLMTDLPSRSNEYTVFNYDIPFLQLVLDGCVDYSTEALNFHPEQTPEEMLLTCIESRSNPKFYLMASEMTDLRYLTNDSNMHMSINFDTWKDTAASIYQEYASFVEQVADSSIVSHERLSENVVRVGYDNGIAVYLNYGEQETAAGSHTLAAKGYLVVKEG